MYATNIYCRRMRAYSCAFLWLAKAQAPVIAVRIGDREEKSMICYTSWITWKAQLFVAGIYVSCFIIHMPALLLGCALVVAVVVVVDSVINVVVGTYFGKSLLSSWHTNNLWIFSSIYCHRWDYESASRSAFFDSAEGERLMDLILIFN